MSVSAIVSGETLQFDLKSFDAKNSEFYLGDTSGRGVGFSICYTLQPETTFVGKDFYVFFLSKNGLVENEIFQVIDGSRKDCRIGWCIPVNALDSKEHDFSNDIHFLRYAYIGVDTALRTLSNEVFYRSPDIDLSSQVRLSEIFHESTALLVISKETLTEDFDIARWLPAFAAYGYFQLGTSDPGLIELKAETVNTKKLRVEPVSSTVDNVDYIATIYSKILPFEKSPLLQFFYLYQIIELLMELVFRQEQVALVQEIVAAQEDVNLTKDLLEKIGRNASEKQRIRLLAHQYSCGEPVLTELRDACNSLLIQLGKKSGTSIETYLYPVRNFLFHQFRNFPATCDSSLQDVVCSLVRCLPLMLTKFKASEGLGASPLS